MDAQKHLHQPPPPLQQQWQQIASHLFTERTFRPNDSFAVRLQVACLNHHKWRDKRAGLNFISLGRDAWQEGRFRKVEGNVSNR